MIMPDIQLHFATSLEQVGAMMAEHRSDVRLLAGGTDLLVDLKTSRFAVGNVISMDRIDGLRGVHADADGLHIGAMTTVTQLSKSPAIQRGYSAILDATQNMAAPQVRNMATVGGNIANAAPCADLPPILTVMSAHVTLWSPSGERNVPLDAFFVGPRATVITEGEVLIAAHVPPPPTGFGAAYQRMSLREGNSIAVAAVAASLTIEAGSIKNARVCLSAVAPIPVCIGEADTILAGRPLDEAGAQQVADIAMKAARPICDIRGSDEYRREVVGVLTRRALIEAARRAEQ